MVDTLPKSKPLVGALARLVSPHSGVHYITLGPLIDPPVDLYSDDPKVPVGTMCVVCGDHTDENITSSTAHVVLLEVDGRPQQYWVYRDELEIL